MISNKNAHGAQEKAWEAFKQKLQGMVDAGSTFEEVGAIVRASPQAVWEWLYKDKGGKRVSFEVMAQRLRAVGLRPEDYYDIEPSPAKGIPLIGLVPCGYDYWLKEVKLPIAEVAAPPGETSPNMFAVIAYGDSLIPKGIEEGFVVFCDPDAPIQQNDIVYVERDNGTTTLKIYGREEGIWTYLHGWSPIDGSGTQVYFDLCIKTHEIKRMAPAIWVKRRI